MSNWMILLFIVGILDLVFSAINYVRLAKLGNDKSAADPDVVNRLISISSSLCMKSFAIWGVALMGAIFLSIGSP